MTMLIRNRRKSAIAGDARKGVSPSVLRRDPNPRMLMVLAVLPTYRKASIAILREACGKDLEMHVSPAHLDATVKTGIDKEWYKSIAMYRLLGNRMFVQNDFSLHSASAHTLVVDLNPRSLTAWYFLILRRVLKRRTLVWGHLHPHQGPDSRTASLRKLMRKISDGTICYTYTDRAKAVAEMPGQAVWVAPNSQFRKKDIFPVPGENRRSVLYVGRLEAAKKVDLLLEGFALAFAKNNQIRLTLVGAGSLETRLRDRAAQLGLTEFVSFLGWIDEPRKLQPLFSEAFCTVSPGFAGLGLTQSLGFGIPMIVSKDELHSPEIELASLGGVTWFASNDAEDLASAIIEAWGGRDNLPVTSLSDGVRNRYSAEAMADGLHAALTNRLQTLEGVN